MHKNKDEVLAFVREHGPILPSQVMRFTGNNLLFASALLSEFVSEKKICLTSAKIGNSPMYYVKGQERRLDMLYRHLGEKPRKAYDLLKAKRIVKDKDCEPWQRIALREIKDFARMLVVKVGESEEVFWQWYLLSEEETKLALKNYFKDGGEEKRREEEAEQATAKIEQQKQLIPEFPRERSKEQKDVFYEMVMRYFAQRNIKVLNEKVIRKSKELEFEIEVESSIGRVRFFVRAKSKNRVNDNDLASAHHAGLSRRLPTLFLSNGEPTKKAKEMLEKENLAFRRI